MSLHDWTLLAIAVDWQNATVSMDVLGPQKADRISATGISELHVSHKEPWGPSVSINCTDGPRSIAPGVFDLTIEMQSGDVIQLVAARIEMPLSDSDDR